MQEKSDFHVFFSVAVACLKLPLMNDDREDDEDDLGASKTLPGRSGLIALFRSWDGLMYSIKRDLMWKN